MKFTSMFFTASAVYILGLPSNILTTSKSSYKLVLCIFNIHPKHLPEESAQHRYSSHKKALEKRPKAGLQKEHHTFFSKKSS